MKFIGLALLLVISVIVFDIGDAYAGSPEYDNRANLYWLQFYIILATVIGVSVVGGIMAYKLRKRRVAA